jgi:hypothetical protein
MMRILKSILFAVIVLMVFSGCKTFPGDVQTISAKRLKDKIAGGWAGKMIGVTYGAPTEFRAQGRTYDDSIRWTPKNIRGSMWQDDIYVQLTFMMTMDKYGIDAPAEKFQEMFAKAGYMLWHANMQARKNYYDSIFPPASGNPEFNPHADDIDFQIEADYLGLMCPGMPATASQMAGKIGHIMNYGDGVYGGIFVSALYTQAFFETNIQKIIENALLSIPAESDYAKVISDVITLHKHYPDNWKAAWKELTDKWDSDHFCAAGETFNIDAKVNGAFIALGLLYGDGDPMKTLEISTRCGQDSDCNPSSAMAVLGVVIGFDKLPDDMKKGVANIGDSLFINTDYSFNKAVKSTFLYATQLITKNGGTAGENEITIAKQLPVVPALEVSFPDVMLDQEIPILKKGAWTFTGNWKTFNRLVGPGETPVAQSLYAENTGDAIEISFAGTGIAIDGNWFKDGGKADVFLDGKFVRTIDNYYFYNDQEHENVTIWHKTGLPDAQHTVKLVVAGKKKPESFGTRLYITKATTYQTAPKKSSSYKFSFEK